MSQDPAVYRAPTLSGPSFHVPGGPLSGQLGVHRLSDAPDRLAAQGADFEVDVWNVARVGQ
ncbi:MAG TPA: hypothetical protein VKT21_06970, partial [Thermoplasmata archaeon]|nr:hypothetical protein [Thermoplasmata archaeon]